MEAICKNFNGLIRQLFDLFKSLPGSLKSNLSIKYMREEMIKAMSAQEDYAIRVLGPYIWNRRAQIAAGDSKSFIDHEYGPVVMALSQQHKFNYMDAIETIRFMKEGFNKGKPDSKKEIIGLVQKLLAEYVEYVKKCREGSK